MLYFPQKWKLSKSNPGTSAVSNAGVPGGSESIWLLQGGNHSGILWHGPRGCSGLLHASHWCSVVHVLPGITSVIYAGNFTTWGKRCTCGHVGQIYGDIHNIFSSGHRSRRTEGSIRCIHVSRSRHWTRYVPIFIVCMHHKRNTEIKLDKKSKSLHTLWKREVFSPSFSNRPCIKNRDYNFFFLQTPDVGYRNKKYITPCGMYTFLFSRPCLKLEGVAV